MGDRMLPLRSILKNHIRRQDIPKPSVPKPSVPERNVPEPSVPKPSVPERNVPEPSVPEPSGPDPRVPSEQFWSKPSSDVYITVKDLKRAQQEIERLKLDYADLEEQATNWNALLEQEIEAKTKLQKERKKGVKIISELQEKLAKERRELSELKAWREK